MDKHHETCVFPWFLLVLSLSLKSLQNQLELAGFGAPRYVLLLSPQGQFSFLGGPPAWAIDATTLRNVIETRSLIHLFWSSDVLRS